MARLLAEGTGAQWTEVWLMVNGQQERAASWPEHTSDRARPQPCHRDAC